MTATRYHLRSRFVEACALSRLVGVGGVILLSVLCGCAGGGSGTAGGAGADESFILPGTFSEGMTVEDFVARFGAANVLTTKARDDEGYLQSTVVLFPEDPTRRAYVDFYDDETLAGVASIAVRDPGSRWRGKSGVRIGMSFAELCALNGKPFAFYGFDGDQRGWAHDQWSPARDGDDGALGALDVAEGDQMYFAVGLRLRSGAGEVTADAYPHDEYVSSDDPRFPRLGELVEVVEFSATTSLDDEW